MSKLNEEELLSILTAVFSYYLSKCNYKETATTYEEAHLQIKEMIQKPEVTEEWIEKKARRLHEMSWCGYTRDEIWVIEMKEAKDFIRSLVEEIK